MACGLTRPGDDGVVRARDVVVMTRIWRWLGRRLGGPPTYAAEFRAERMDGLWQPEYLELGGGAHATPGRVPRLMHR